MEIASKFKDMDNNNLEAHEKKIGAAAARALKASFLNQIKKTFDSRTGALEKTNVRARYREGRLDRLIINSPKYSFTTHYGSAKKGDTKQTNRSPTAVRSFARHLENSVVDHQVKAHSRAGGTVKAHIKGINYKATDHIAKVFRATNALDVLATELGNSRAVKILSQFDW